MMKKIYDEEETLREITYLGDRVSAGEAYQAAVTARKRCGQVKIRECGDMKHRRIFPLKLKGAVYKSYVSPAILYGSKAWCLKDGNCTKNREIHGEAICGVQPKDREKLRI